jgi:hypothetical protein
MRSIVKVALVMGILALAPQAHAVKWEHVPGALMRSDCIYSAPNGADIDMAHGNIRVNGKLIQHFEPCPEPAIRTRPDRTGNAPSPSALPVPGAAPGGWVEGAEVDGGIPSGKSFNQITSTWNVPPKPPMQGALIYIFDGLEPSDQSEIVQPVLQYGVGPKGGGANDWNIASWLVANGNAVVVSPLVTVNPGDQLYGYVQVTSQTGNQLNWRIQIQDNTSGWYTWATFSYIGNPWNHAYTGILEAYGVTDCSQLSVGGENGYFDIPSTDLWYGNPNANTFVYFGNESRFNGRYYAYGNAGVIPYYAGPYCQFDQRWMGFWRFFW